MESRARYYYNEAMIIGELRSGAGDDLKTN